MPTTNSIAHELWTADEFLEWLEPGVFAATLSMAKYLCILRSACSMPI